MNDSQKIEELLHYFRMEQKDFAEKCGLEPNNITKIKVGKCGISKRVFDKIINAFPEVNKTWLATGEGEMLKNETKERYSQSNRKLIPFYDITAEAGTVQVSNMDVEERPDEWIDPGDWFLDANSAMRVHGDSMFPVYKSGSIVVMKEVHDKSLIIYGQDYVLITSEYRVIKRIQKSDKVGFWLACSVNNETWEKGELAGKLIHEPFDVPIDRVNKIYRVLGCVLRNESSRTVYTKKKMSG